MGDKSKGGLDSNGKYIVYHRDGSDEVGGRHYGHHYFVLDITPDATTVTDDPYAVPALRAYAKHARIDGFEALANDLEQIVGSDDPALAPVEQSETEDEQLSREQVVQAITDIQEARESHVLWANHLRNEKHALCEGCNNFAAHIGDTKYHYEWIAKYDNVIAVLARTPFTAAAPSATAEGGNPKMVYSKDVMDTLCATFDKFKGQTVPVSEIAFAVYRDLVAVREFEHSAAHVDHAALKSELDVIRGRLNQFHAEYERPIVVKDIIMLIEICDLLLAGLEAAGTPPQAP